MPKIQWEQLPRKKWAHLRDRARERKASESDRFELAEWKRQPGRARWGLVQGFWDIQALRHGKASEHLSDGRAVRQRQAAVTTAACRGNRRRRRCGVVLERTSFITCSFRIRVFQCGGPVSVCRSTV